MSKSSPPVESAPSLRPQSSAKCVKVAPRAAFCESRPHSFTRAKCTALHWLRLIFLSLLYTFSPLFSVGFYLHSPRFSSFSRLTRVRRLTCDRYRQRLYADIAAAAGVTGTPSLLYPTRRLRGSLRESWNVQVLRSHGENSREVAHLLEQPLSAAVGALPRSTGSIILH